MKVSGFTFIRNAIKYDYPIVEALRSILPLCDEFVIVCGNSEDGTTQLIEAMNEPKIRIVHSVWDDSLREGGRVLAEETNKAFDAVSADADWCFYIQADEIVHEKYLPAIREAMLKYKDDKRVEGLLFDYVHFYASYDYIGDSRRWYRNEIRIVRNDKSIRSYKDAQGFRRNGKKLNVKKVDATVYHYGWVKPPHLQQAKQEYFQTLWHADAELHKYVAQANEFDYSQIDSLAPFRGTHPLVMKQRIAEMNWKFDTDLSVKKLSFKSRALQFVEKLTGWRIGEYRNYKVI